MKGWTAAVTLAACLAFAASGLAQGRTTADGVYSIEQARRGAAHVRRCMVCHGDDLEGDLGPPLVGPDYVARWSGRSLSDFFDRVVTNFNGLGRQGGPDEVGTVEQRAVDFTAYLLLQNGFRSGPRALDFSPDTLRAVTIVEPPRR